jgi:hypothetical protein
MSERSARSEASAPAPRSPEREEILLPFRSQYTPAELDAIGSAWKLWYHLLRVCSWEHGNGWFQTSEVAAELNKSRQTVGVWLRHLSGKNSLRRKFIKVEYHGPQRRALITLSDRELGRIASARGVMQRGRPSTLKAVADTPPEPPAAFVARIPRPGVSRG